jgi:hypothetical protein
MAKTNILVSVHIVFMENTSMLVNLYTVYGQSDNLFMANTYIQVGVYAVEGKHTHFGKFVYS